MLRRLAPLWGRLKTLAGWMFGEIIYPLWLAFKPTGASKAPGEKKGDA